MTDTIWSPTQARIEGSALRAYLDWLQEREGRPFPDHDALWAWSVEDVGRFWVSLVDYYGVEFSAPHTEVRTADPMPRTRWFTGATLNWAEQALRRGAGDAVALVCVQEGGLPAREITFDELRRTVAAVAGWLRRAGVRPGDRVGAYLPNTEHAVIGALAAAAVGAVWACCSPDFGAEGTTGRLAQLEPTVLIATDGYHWNGKEVDRADVVAHLRENLTTLRHVVHVPCVFDRPHPEGATPWDEVVATEAPLEFEQVEFSHPLWVLFTSGTTGLPKGLVHGHGGITLEGLKWSGLYAGMRPGERLFAFTSTGWALWNMQVNVLVQGAGIVLYEGSPGHPAGAVWEVAARTGAQVVLVGAAVITATAGTGVRPVQEHDLSRLRHVMVSGSALPEAGYHWVMDNVSPDVRIDSTSGGTDVSGAFVGANEYTPVRPGRIGGRLAGVDCAAWDEDGNPVVESVGDLVITQPMPSMPVHLWNDPDDARYTESYFDTWPGVWRHGDWVTMHADGSVSVHGRSDSTLNRQGVRLGSSDFYDVLETLPEIAETLVVGVDLPDDGYWLGLFVVPTPGQDLDDALKQKIVTTLRTRLTPRHVPDEIVEAPAVPHTLSGKRLEVPIKKLLSGRPLEKAANLASVDDPDALRWYARFAADRLD
ncbi:acetoacetate--CoA ligase [Pseudonocardia sp. KRD-184]|uniref:Acetoacetate--CoA ligase n=1 Tax=Pseudonocardia oceani TaxID=2792013 RepID=A0ABS6U4S9_9PSEU|nr:acetoacetate--CoA ligase [Pseudonocardia oceani]MBW0092448.1 acetoacetate--CoA ligase [Pseudonocardia oceani]MBW0099051.1 acetoacetate--CoA ligase [Pseudonocardia oceani]MBW0125279.1 acetoacetate--CoA ligase [Pseudonocardia oceani]MBW0127001.1 acetoacetate--CoA ligase [Pseudonocardia oceani]